MSTGYELLAFNVLSVVKYRFILVYRPPCSSPKSVIQIKNDLLIDAIYDLHDPHVTTFILGDFNFPDIKWNSSPPRINNIDDKFFNAMLNLGMTQFVQDPTIVSRSGLGNTLDLIFSNDVLSIQIQDHLPPLSTSDHHMIQVFNFHCPI